MSINILNLGTNGIKDLAESYIKEHASKLAIVEVMNGLFIAIGLAATGDFNQAVEAGCRRCR